MKLEHEVGIVTGNWGCGASGRDPELKAIIQWLNTFQVNEVSESVHFNMWILRSETQRLLGKFSKLH